VCVCVCVCTCTLSKTHTHTHAHDTAQRDAKHDHTDRLNKMTVKQLQDQLRSNNMKIGGIKSELVNRCLDGVLRGSVPPCPVCKTGHLRYAAGIYRCGGSFDKFAKQPVPCTYQTSDIRRKEWIEPARDSH
jgi:hypothetical protein